MRTIFFDVTGSTTTCLDSHTFTRRGPSATNWVRTCDTGHNMHGYVIGQRPLEIRNPKP